MPHILQDIYGETLAALDNSLPLLGAIGLRAIIETICKDREAKGNDLMERIKSLATQGILTREQADILHKLRFLGNVSAHEVRSAKSEELIAALDIAETMIKTIYILPELGKSIQTDKKKHK